MQQTPGISRRKLLEGGAAAALGFAAPVFFPPVLHAPLAFAAAPQAGARRSGPLRVAASIDAVASIAKAVGGAHAVVETILPKGASPHAYEPTPAVIETLREADLIVFNGFGMEPWAGRLLAALDRPDALVLEAAEGIEPLREAPHAHGEEGHADDHEHDHEHESEHGHDHDHEDEAGHAHAHPGDVADGPHDPDLQGGQGALPGASDELFFPESRTPLSAFLAGIGGRVRSAGHAHGALNPHVWLSPAGARHEAKRIAAAFSEADPAHAGDFAANAQAFEAALARPAARFRAAVEGAKRRYFVVGHAAFGYLCRDYGLREVSVEGIYAEGEPSPKALARLVDFARSAGVKTIFAEKAASPAVSRVLAEEVGASVVRLYTMETPEEGLGFVERLASNLEAIGRSLA